MKRKAVRKLARLCPDCGIDMTGDKGERCMGCAGPYRSIIRYASGQVGAVLAVQRAKRKGLLPHISSETKCADCGQQADRYDHRDYNKPLEVEAVCHSCNLFRGPAIWVGFAQPYESPSVTCLYFLLFWAWKGPSENQIKGAVDWA